MSKRFYLVFFLLFIGTVATYAQWTAQDSIKLQKFLSGESELQLNKEETKHIRLETSPISNPFNQSPLMDTEKPSLQFNTDLPSYFSDSIFRKKKIYLTLRPYSAFTRYDEDPVYAQKYTYPMAVKFDLRNGPIKEHKRPVQIIGITSKLMAPVGPGISYSFSMEDVLQRIFSKKGRARLHNAEHANAWKTY